MENLWEYTDNNKIITIFHSDGSQYSRPKPTAAEPLTGQVLDKIGDTKSAATY